MVKRRKPILDITLDVCTLSSSYTSAAIELQEPWRRRSRGARIGLAPQLSPPGACFVRDGSCFRSGGATGGEGRQKVTAKEIKHGGRIIVREPEVVCIRSLLSFLRAQLSAAAV
jgi:hypothetical protein